MKTMSHTPAQRKAWHEGKKRPNENKYQWFARVFKARQYCGAFTPTKLKKCIIYEPLDES